MSFIKPVLFTVFLACLTPGWAQNKPEVTIGILTDQLTENFNIFIESLKSNITVIVGEEANVVYSPILTNGFDIAKAKNNYEQLLQNETDIIMSFGMVNNAVLAGEKSYPKPTLALGMANADLIELPDGNEGTSINNLNYTLAPISFSKDLDAFYKLCDFEALGIIMNQRIIENLPIASFLSAYFADKSISYKLIPIDNTTSLDLKDEDIDAVYIVGGIYMDDIPFRRMVEEINKNNLPSFSAMGIEDVQRGILATNQPETYIDNYLRRIALNVESIIRGANASDLPMEISYKQQLTLNYSTAKKIGFPLRYSSIENIDFISGDQDYHEGISYTMADIMQGVIDSNLNLKAIKQDIELASQDVKLSKSNFLPNLIGNADANYTDPKVAEISLGQNPEFRTSANLQIGQTIYSENAAANIDISKLQLEAQTQAYNASELDKIYEAAIAYINALISKTNVQIQNENMKTTRKNLAIAELNYEVGEASKYDQLRFKSELANNTQAFIDANRDFFQSLYAINQLLNNPIDQDIDVAEANIGEGILTGYSYDRLKTLMDNPTARPAFVKFLVEEAYRNSPELQNLDFNLEANERFYKLNSSGRFVPTVSLQGLYSYEISRYGAGADFAPGFGVPPSNTYSLGLNVSLPIVQQNQRTINKQTAQIQELQLELYTQDTRLAIEKNVNDIVADLMNRVVNVNVSRIAEKAAEEALYLTQNSYAEGEALLIELVDAQNNYLKAQLARANANYTYLLAAVTLERAIGYYFLLNSEERNVDLLERANQFILESK